MARPFRFVHVLTLLALAAVLAACGGAAPAAAPSSIGQLTSQYFRFQIQNPQTVNYIVGVDVPPTVVTPLPGELGGHPKHAHDRAFFDLGGADELGLAGA